MFLDYVGLPIFFGMVIVVPLMPLVCVSAIHTAWTRRRQAGLR